MAEFCSQCSPFEEYDIDLKKMALTLRKGYSQSFLCEGCSNRALWRDENGQLSLIRITNGKEETLEVSLDDLIQEDRNLRIDG